MDNRFLARGKWKGNGKWLYGNLLCDGISDVMAIITYVNLDGNICDLSEINIGEIILETAGRYTGLNDKNGKKIFEGDIIKAVAPYKFDVEHSNFVVSWDKYYAMFILHCVTDVWTEIGFGDIYVNRSEVIGNIHDNPELIGGNKNDTK